MKNTSINPYNVAVIDQSGKVGTVRYFQKGGRTYVRSAANRVDSNSNPRSDGQMKTRLLYNSRNAMYRTLKGLLKGAFQFKPRHLSEYQAYMQANAGIGAYMTKDEYRSGMIVPLPVKIAEGELAEITLTYNQPTEDVITNLNSGAASDVSTIAKLSKTIVDNNDGFEYGDQITIFDYDFFNSRRNITIIVLDENNTSAQTLFSARDEKLVLATASENAAVAAIHSNSDRQMSNSEIVLCSVASETYASYITDEAFEAARDSYGKAKESILVPAKQA